MSRLWHHVSIPAEVDSFVIPSPTWLPRFVHVLLHSLSLYSLSLSLPLFLSSLSSLPLSDGLSRDGEHGLSPLFLRSSTPLSSFFSSLHREREKSLLPLSRSFSLLLFFLSLSPLPRFLPRPRTSAATTRPFSSARVSRKQKIWPAVGLVRVGLCRHRRRRLDGSLKSFNLGEHEKPLSRYLGPQREALRARQELPRPGL